MLNVDGWTDGRTNERTNRWKLARLCLPAKAGATKMTKPTVPEGHLAHIDFWPVAGLFESLSCVENSQAKNKFVFHRNSRSCNSCFDWCIAFLNCTGTSIQ